MITTTDQSKGPSNKKGFTLVEIVITVGLLSIIIAMGLSAVTFISQSTGSLTNYSDMSKNSRIALERISRDLRMGYNINSATTTKLNFDIYGKAGASTNIILEYSAADDTLYRTANGGAKQEILEDLTNFNFNYYNLRRESTTAPISIKEVQLEGLMEKHSLVLSNTNYVISARYMMRNHTVTN